MKKALLLTLITTAFFLILVIPAVISQYPAVNFHQFYGDVTGVSAGTQIKAEMGNQTFTTTVDSNGRYGYSPLFFVEDGTDGDNIRFIIKNKRVATATFETGAITELDLRYTTTRPRRRRAPSTGGGGGGGSSAREWYSSISGGGGGIIVANVTNQTGAGIECFDDWICTGWGRCEEPGTQTRTCYLNDYENCTEALPKPPEKQSCELPPPTPPPPPSCSDGIKNQDETFTDCGGSKCKACDPHLDCMLDRDCVTNYCNPATKKCDWRPPVEAPTPPPPEPSYWWIWLIVGAFILIGAGLGTLFYFEHRKKAGLEIPEEGLPPRLEELDKYAKTFLKKGVSKQRIAKKLEQAGWKKEDIEKVLK